MMSAEIGREKTTYSQIATKTGSAIATAETTFDWPNDISFQDLHSYFWWHPYDIHISAILTSL